MKIAIDTSPLSNLSQTRGIGVYTSSLINELRLIPTIEIEEIKKDTFSCKADIVHYPFFDFFFLTLPLIKKGKTVVTIHDCTPLVFPDHYPPGIKGRIKFLIQKMSLRGTDAIITDSQNSKNDIKKYLLTPTDKIFVIPLAATEGIASVRNEKVLKEIRKKYLLPEEFVLYVGDVNYNKNLPNLVRACRLSRISLVLAGKKTDDKRLEAANTEEEPLVELNKLINEGTDVIRLGFVDKKDLAVLYSLATVYCQPSLYEGFGLQILEAMKCGCPVVTSNVSSLPEIAQDAAVLVNPEEVEKISEGIIRCWKDKKFRTEIIKKGFRQAEKFSWSKTALQTVKVYEKVFEK